MFKLTERHKDLLETWGMEFNTDPKTLAAFLADLKPEKPAFPYAVSSVERTMFSLSTKASALEAGLDPDTQEIKDAITGKLQKTPYTNWSGD